LSDEWRALLLRFPDRFVYGSDTWIPSRWSQVDTLTREAQDWLATMPPAVAQAIAYGNAQRLFGAPGKAAATHK
jgi:predicted TIM-barrel fold metal-dependent hydrolase